MSLEGHEAKFTVGSVNSSPDELVDVDITSNRSTPIQNSFQNKHLHSEFDRHSPRSRDNSLSDVDRKRRRPFHYSTIATYTSDEGNLQHAVDSQDSATLNRVRYYQRLQPPNEDALNIPDHVLPPHIFSVFPTAVITDAQGKQHSIITIFSIWNTMMGTSLLSMPWAIQQAGFGMGIALLVVMAGLTLYTCYRVVQSVESVENNGVLVEFSDVCKSYLGRWGEFLSVFFSLSALLGAMIVYWVLMSNFLYNTVAFFYHKFHNTQVNHASFHNASGGVICISAGNTSLAPANTTKSTFDHVWDQTLTVPLFLCILIFPLINFKSPTFFTKFNALGTLSVMFLLSYVCVKASEWGINIDFQDITSEHFAEVFNWNFPALSGILALGYFIHNAVSSVMRMQRHPEKNVKYGAVNQETHVACIITKAFSWHFPALTGILALGYFIHNCVSSIIRNQKHPENNGRDLTIAYILVAVTYLFVGALFYVTFPLPKRCIADNLLDNFSHSDTLSFAARFFLLFQMITLFPLLVYITRVQFMDQLFGKAYPSVKHVMALNMGLLTISVLFAIFLPSIGTIIRFSGAFCGLAYIFTLPCVVYLMDQKQKGTLTWPKIIIHGFVILLGLLNFIAQFILLEE